MPLLLAALLADFIHWLVGFFGKKLTAAITVGATFIGGWLALQIALVGLWTALGFTLPEIMVEPMQFAAYALPSNFNACLAACMAGKAARWLWDVQVEWIKVSAAAAA